MDLDETPINIEIQIAQAEILVLLIKFFFLIRKSSDDRVLQAVRDDAGTNLMEQQPQDLLRELSKKLKEVLDKSG